MTKTAVVLGAGLAGTKLTWALVGPAIQEAAGHELKVILVSPNEDFYWNLAAPRALIPGALPPDTIFWNLKKAFAAVPPSKLEIVAGTARRLDPHAKTVSVLLNNDTAAASTTREIAYDVVFIATGSRASVEGAPWKNVGTSAQLRSAMAELSGRIARAESIVVGGAGFTGVELAGELGLEYAKSAKKEVTLVAAGKDVLDHPGAVQGARDAARGQLAKLGVKVVTGSRVEVKEASTAKGQTLLSLTKPDGSTTELATDLYIPTYGVTPNTSFLPPAWLDPSSSPPNRLKVDPTLRIPNHPDIFAIGDAAAAAGKPAQSIFAVEHVEHLKRALPGYFRGGVEGGEKMAAYVPKTEVMFAASVGRNGGTGQMGTMRLPSLMVWWFKSKTLLVEKGRDLVLGKD